MPPAPNTGEVTDLNGNVKEGSPKSVQKTIKDLAALVQQSKDIISVKPYDETEKEWEQFSAKTCNSSNVTEKIKKFEERIQTLILEDKDLLSHRTRRKSDKNLSANDISSGVGDQDSSSPEKIRASDDKINYVSNGVKHSYTNGNGTTTHENGSKISQSNGNGTMTYQNGTNPVQNESNLENVNIGLTRSWLLFWYIHITVICGLYLYSTGQVVNEIGIISFAFLCSLMSMGVHRGLQDRITVRSKTALFLISLICPMISKDSYFEWVRRAIISKQNNYFMHERLPLGEDIKRGRNWNDILYQKSKAGKSIDESRRLTKIPLPVAIPIAVIIPLIAVVLPWLLWNESLWASYCIAWQLQSCISLYVLLLIKKVRYGRFIDIDWQPLNTKEE